MTKRQAIDRIKFLVQSAGAERLRALFQKYNLAGTPRTVAGVITGMELYGSAFFNDLLRLSSDALNSQPHADDAATTGGGSSWVNDALGWAEKGANIFGSIWGAINGTGSAGQTVPTTNAAGQVVYVPVANSSSGSNTTLWVILGIVGIVILGLVVFLAVRKK
jgi:hypothetical protein